MAPQARWLVPNWQRKSKEVGPQGSQRFRTTSSPSRLAGIPLTGPSSTAAWRKRRQQAGPRGRSITASRPGRSPAARGPSSFLSRLDRAKATAKQGRKESIKLEEHHSNPHGDPDDRAEGGRPKKALPKTTKPPPPPHRRATRRSSTRMRRSPMTRAARTMMASRTALPLAMKRSSCPSRLAGIPLAGPNSMVAWTIGPKAAAPRNLSAISTRTMRSSTTGTLRTMTASMTR
jgi:hypothetical protein